MRTISSIKWTDISIEHIARHAIKPAEIEEVCFNEHDVPFIRSGRGNLHYVFGKTYAGRFLFVVVRFIRRGEIRVITATQPFSGCGLKNIWPKKQSVLPKKLLSILVFSFLLE